MLSAEALRAHADEHAEADALLEAAAKEGRKGKAMLPGAIKKQRKKLLESERNFVATLSQLQQTGSSGAAAAAAAAADGSVSSARSKIMLQSWRFFALALGVASVADVLLNLEVFDFGGQ